MRKILTGIATMALVISVSSITAFAAGGGRGRNFVDSDNDGMCDYYNTSCQFIDNDGDGICDNYRSNGCGNGAGYVDADGDGICDNFTAGTSKNNSGVRRGRCSRQGRRGR